MYVISDLNGKKIVLWKNSFMKKNCEKQIKKTLELKK